MSISKKTKQKYTVRSPVHRVSIKTVDLGSFDWTTKPNTIKFLKNFIGGTELGNSFHQNVIFFEAFRLTLLKNRIVRMKSAKKSG